VQGTRRERNSSQDPNWVVFQRRAADWRVAFTGFSVGLLQLLHPGIGAGVSEHSDFFDDPFDRVFRSFPRIWATILADEGEAAARARAIRDVHRGIKGVDHQGRRYHALDPATYWWAHATFTWGIIEAAHRVHHRRPGPFELDALYAGSVVWWRRYGLTDRPVPPDYRAFTTTFDRICAEELELTPAAERALYLALHGRFEIPVLPPLAQPMAGVLTTPVARLAAIGGLPEIVRKRFGIPWSTTDQVALAAVQKAVREAGRALPGPLNRWTFGLATRSVGAAMPTVMLPHWAA
jgi:uncharacterized protein (DUF2236 family)